MKRDSNITQEYLKSILDYDPETGIFTWKWREDWPYNVQVAFSGKPVGTITPRNYIQITINYRAYPASRLAWLYMTGKWPNGDVDHCNRNTMDNRFENLRDATPSQNGYNKKIPENNTSGHKGCVWDASRNKWYVTISANKKRHFLGRFDTLEAAHSAYCEAAHRLHGDFARTE